ncbi:MAG: transglycosylase SLT domain-containing protein [Parvibaculum sp.]|nr:transglycosylase SLT domain-containing protein [Parvibaculum sp.]
MHQHQRSGGTKRIAFRAVTAGLCLAASISMSAHAATPASATPSASVKAKTVEITDTPLSVWAFCERATVATEMAQRLPRAVLFSVAMVESGRFNPKTKKTRPWPWTINAEGQSFYFKSKSEAVKAARLLMKRGVRSFDVGCMQINMRYHPNAFADLNAAFDPITNVAYGAEFLKQLHSRTNSWPKAIAAYHSQTKTRNGPYFARVIDVWTDQHARISQLAHVLREQAQAQVTAQLRQTQDEPVFTQANLTSAVITTPARVVVRPAPKVLDGTQMAQVRETAGGGVGLRLTIADSDFADLTAQADRPAPQVMNNNAPVQQAAKEATSAETALSVSEIGETGAQHGAATMLADASPLL